LGRGISFCGEGETAGFSFPNPLFFFKDVMVDVDLGGSSGKRMPNPLHPSKVRKLSVEISSYKG